METNSGLTALKELLFEEENKKYREFNNKLREVNERIDESLKARDLPDAEVNEIIEKMMEVMPDKLGPTITATLKVQIKESKDDVVQALFPIIGQMIKKYVAQEMAVLTEGLDRQLEQALSFEGIKMRMKALFTGVKYSELILQKATEPQIQQIFIVEQDSGILKASYTRSKALDQDMISGMLTAIKSFVEDAFEERERSLQNISYDDFNIYVHDFSKFYIAVAMTGNTNASYKQRLDDAILLFVKEIMMKKTDRTSEDLEARLSLYFKQL
ncbi:MAG: hypothetical protein AB8B73_08020 [Ekhidna sp.]